MLHFSITAVVLQNKMDQQSDENQEEGIMKQGYSDSEHLSTNQQDAVTLFACISDSLRNFSKLLLVEQRAAVLWMTVWKTDISLGLAGAARQHRYTLHTHLV